jgi:hypothetical protein
LFLGLGHKARTGSPQPRPPRFSDAKHGAPDSNCGRACRRWSRKSLGFPALGCAPENPSYKRTEKGEDPGAATAPGAPAEKCGGEILRNPGRGANSALRSLRMRVFSLRGLVQEARTFIYPGLCVKPGPALARNMGHPIRIAVEHAGDGAEKASGSRRWDVRRRTQATKERKRSRTQAQRRRLGHPQRNAAERFPANPGGARTARFAALGMTAFFPCGPGLKPGLFSSRACA